MYIHPWKQTAGTQKLVVSRCFFLSFWGIFRFQPFVFGVVFQNLCFSHVRVYVQEGPWGTLILDSDTGDRCQWFSGGVAQQQGLKTPGNVWSMLLWVRYDTKLMRTCLFLATKLSQLLRPRNHENLLKMMVKNQNAGICVFLRLNHLVPCWWPILFPWKGGI